MVADLEVRLKITPGIKFHALLHMVSPYLVSAENGCLDRVKNLDMSGANASSQNRTVLPDVRTINTGITLTAEQSACP